MKIVCCESIESPEKCRAPHLDLVSFTYNVSFIVSINFFPNMLKSPKLNTCPTMVKSIKKGTRPQQAAELLLPPLLVRRP